MAQTGKEGKSASPRKISVDRLRKISFLGSGEHQKGETQPLLLSGAPPIDMCMLTYLIFFLHGVGHLLPWNFFITAYDYFKEKFTCPSNDTTCEGFSASFENWFSVAAMFPIMTMTAINIWLQSKVHYKYRMVIALLTMLVLFTLTTAFVGIHTSGWLKGFFVVTIFTIVIINTASAVFQSSTFGFVGIFPPKYTSIVMSGQAVAGIVAALVSIFTKAVGGVSSDSKKHLTGSTFGYFSTAVLIILLCLVSLFFMLHLRFVRYYLAQTSVKTQKAKQEAAVRASVNASVEGKVIVTGTSIPFIRIFRAIWVYAISVFLVFTVTLSLFPAIQSVIRPSSEPIPEWITIYYTDIVCFLMFNLTDFVGRYITHWITIGNNRYILFALSVVRTVFIPLFLLCNARPKDDRSLPVVFNSDVYPVLFMTIFGLTNGYFGSLAMINAPMTVSPEHRETASTIMAFFLSLGLVTGGTLSFLWTYIIS